MIVVMARIRVKTGFEEEIKGLAKAAVAATVKEEGCVSYRFLQDAYDAREFCFVEEWTGLDALRAHTRTAHFAAWREASGPLIEERDLKLYEASETRL